MRPTLICYGSRQTARLFLAQVLNALMFYEDEYYVTKKGFTGF